MADLATAARTVVERCLAVRADEDVLVICDPSRTDLGEAMLEAALNAQGDAVLAVVPERPSRGTEPPPTIASALREADVFIAPMLPSLSHTTARKNASESGARGATMPGSTAEMVARLMTADFDVMARRSKELAALLEESDTARVTCTGGTDLTFDLTGRPGISDDGDLAERGAFGNLPCGEAFISPAGGEGVAVVHSIARLGLTEEPVTLTVEGGRLGDASGDMGAELMRALTAHGDIGLTLAELGIGTNEQATLTGNMLEDEKMLGTAHIAFGASAGIGGTVSVPVHLDSVILKPTVTVGDTTVVDCGRFVLGV